MNHSTGHSISQSFNQPNIRTTIGNCLSNQIDSKAMASPIKFPPGLNVDKLAAHGPNPVNSCTGPHLSVYAGARRGGEEGLAGRPARGRGRFGVWGP